MPGPPRPAGWMKEGSSRRQKLLSEWLTFNLGLAVPAALPEDVWLPKKPSGEDTVLLIVFFWGRGGGQLGPAEGAFSLEVGRKEPGGNTWLSAGGGEWFGSDECPRGQGNTTGFDSSICGGRAAWKRLALLNLV